MNDFLAVRVERAECPEFFWSLSRMKKIGQPAPEKPNVKNDNTGLPPAEYIAVDFYLKQQLMLADFPHAKLAPYLVSVNNVFPCPTCEFPIARLRVAGYVRVCDCFKNSIGWDADVLSEHACSGGGFQ